jgi:AraC-like DNA-binding protein
MAIEFMRAAVCRPISMTDLVQHCGVAERTLNKHFRTFLNVSPMRYLRRLRLAAAREALLAGEPGNSVTEVARRFEFNHFGRFADQYRRCFGESPSATLRHGRVAALSEPTLTHGCKRLAREDSGQELRSPLPSRDRSSIAVLPCQTPANEPNLYWVAASIADATAAALCSARSLAVMVPSLNYSRRGWNLVVSVD